MYKFLLSLRYFRSRFLTLASLLAITFGVAMLVIVLGIMGGYGKQIEKNLRGQESHLQIRGPATFGIHRYSELSEAVLGVEGVTAVAPFIEQLGVYHSGLSFRPSVLIGIDPVAQSRVGELGRYTLRPAELEAISKEHIEAPAGEGADASTSRGTRTAQVIQAVDRLVADPSRAPLSAEEIEALYDLPWRQEVLLRA